MPRDDLANAPFFDLPYTVQADGTKLGVWTLCLNAAAGCLALRTESLLNEVRDDLEEFPANAVPREELMWLLPVALRRATAEICPTTVHFVSWGRLPPAAGLQPLGAAEVRPTQEPK